MVFVIWVLYADEDDLETLTMELSAINDIEHLGLALGIRMSALDKIRLDYSQVEKQKTRVIYYWLTRRDIVRQRQNEHPNRDGLADAVARINPGISDRIRQQYC